MQEQGVPATPHPNLDSTKTFINAHDSSLIVHRDRTNTVLPRSATRGLDERPVLPGILPARLLGGIWGSGTSSAPRREMMRIPINPDLADDALDAPRGTNMQPLDRAARRAFQARQAPAAPAPSM